MVEKIVRLAVGVLINDGQLEKFKSLAERMTAGTKPESGTLGYEWFAGPDPMRFRLVETYADAAAIEAHFMGPVVQKMVPELAALCKIELLEFYGDPGPKVREMAGGMGAIFFDYWIGIGR